METKWISAEERLPEEGVEVVALDDFGEKDVYILTYEKDMWCERGEGPCLFKVLYWLPMPPIPEDALNGKHRKKTVPEV